MDIVRALQYLSQTRCHKVTGGKRNIGFQIPCALPSIQITTIGIHAELDLSRKWHTRLQLHISANKRGGSSRAWSCYHKACYHNVHNIEVIYSQFYIWVRPTHQTYYIWGRRRDDISTKYLLNDTGFGMRYIRNYLYTCTVHRKRIKDSIMDAR